MEFLFCQVLQLPVVRSYRKLCFSPIANQEANHHAWEGNRVFVSSKNPKEPKGFMGARLTNFPCVLYLPPVVLNSQFFSATVHSWPVGNFATMFIKNLLLYLSGISFPCHFSFPTGKERQSSSCDSIF